MKRKTIAILVILMVCALALPTAITALAEAAPTRTEALDLTTQVTEDMLADEGWAWDSENKILTLNGLDLVTDSTPAITAPAGTTVILADGSVNSITTSDASGRGIYCLGSLIVKTENGDVNKGTLNITTGSSGRGIMYNASGTVSTLEDVELNFSNVVLNINALRSIETYCDPSSVADGSTGKNNFIVMANVKLAHTTNSSGGRVFSIYNWPGNAKLAITKSEIKGQGDILVQGNGDSSICTISESSISTPGILQARYGAETIITIEKNSSIAVNNVKIGHWGHRDDLARLEVLDSSMFLGPVKTSDGAIEVGCNHFYSAEAIFKNSKIVAVNVQKAAISVSRYWNAGESYEEARGDITIDNCELLFAGTAEYGELTREESNITNSSITTVLYKSVSKRESVDGLEKITVPTGAIITSDGVEYTVPEDGSNFELSFDIDEGTVSVPSGTELKKADNTIISSEGALTFECGKDVIMPSGEATKVSFDDGRVVEMTPENSAPLTIGNGKVVVPENTYVHGQNGSVDLNHACTSGGFIEENGTLWCIILEREFVYTGLAIEPSVSIHKNGVPLTSGVTVEYENNINVGTAIATIKVDGDEITRESFEIFKATYDMSGVSFVGGSIVYDGQAHSLEISGELPSGVSVTYENNDNVGVGEYTVTAKFSGDYENYNVISDMVATLIIDKALVYVPELDVTDFVYNGSEQTYSVAENALYTVSGNVETNVGEYVVTVALKDTLNYAWIGGSFEALTYDFVIKHKDIQSANVSLAWTEKVHTGSEIEQEVLSVVVDGLDVTYTVSGNTAVEVGEYTLTVKGTGNFTGEATAAWRLVHNAGEWVVTLEPNCTEKGSKHKLCTVCNVEVEVAVIAANGHTVVIDEGKKATCTETGLSEGKHCSVCNEVLVEQEVISIKRHTASEWIIDVEPTESAHGHKHKECEVCGKILVEAAELYQNGVSCSGEISVERSIFSMAMLIIVGAFVGILRTKARNKR